MREENAVGQEWQPLTGREVVAALLEESGMTAYELNKACGFSHGYIYYLVKPTSRKNQGGKPIAVGFDTVSKILQATGKSWGWIDTLNFVAFKQWKEKRELDARFDERRKKGRKKSPGDEGGN